jgi:hypothetical protein
MRPEDPQLLTRYERVFERLQNRIDYTEASFRVNKNRRHGPIPLRRAVVQAGNEINLSWSGARVFAPTGSSYRWLVGQWMVPNVSAPTENQDYYSAIWLGIDGDGTVSTDVCQIGVNCDVSRTGSSSSRSIYPWYEWFNGTDPGEVQFGPVQVNAGDLVSAVVCTAGAGATEATLFFANWTSGGATSFVIEAPSGTTLVGNCAEWVVERPLVSGVESMLADYGEVFFSGCDAGLYSGSGDLQVIGGGTQVHIDMIPPPLTTPLSAGVLVAPEVVQCVYNGPR